MAADLPKHTAIVFVLLLHLLACHICKSSSSPILGIDTFLSNQFQLDPQATNDSFPSLPTILKKPLSQISFSKLSHLISHLLSLKVSFPLHVHLIGSFPPSSTSLLQTYIAATVFSERFHVIGANPHHLAIKHTLHLDADISASSIASQIGDAIETHLSTSPSSFASALQPIPVNLIDASISRDFVKRQLVEPGYHLYFLNPKFSSKPRSYAYSYTQGQSSPAFSNCLGTLFTGLDRYVWIDLAAGPVDYGPAVSGEGVLPRGKFHPLTSLHGRSKSDKVFTADLASLVWSAYHTLLVPPLRIPVVFDNDLVIEFIHIHGSNDKDPQGLDFDSIEETFLHEARNRELLLSGQSLRFKNHQIHLPDCAICSFALARAKTSYTSRFLFTNFTLIVSEYLDSKRLHQVLSDSADEFKRLVDDHTEEEDDFGRVIPVYVFDLDYDNLLMLDHYHQAVAFKDMVIAVRTRSTMTVSDYSCNGRPVITQTRDLNRHIVGSILQSMWGVSPTHLTWSEQHNSTLVDYTWSVGNIPFGPFSYATGLSFVQKDAARRNLLLTSLNYSIASAIDAIESMIAHGGDKKVLKKSKHLNFVQRWNFLKYKLDKAISSLSHLDYNMSLFFMRAAEHDLFAIHTLVYEASQELEASLVCFQDPPFPWVAAVSAGCIFGILAFLCTQRGSLFKSKRKRF